MSSTDGLCKDHGDVDNLEWERITSFLYFFLNQKNSKYQLPPHTEPTERSYPDLYFGTMLHLLLLRDCIGDHHSFKAGVVDARDSRAREDAMC